MSASLFRLLSVLSPSTLALLSATSSHILSSHEGAPAAWAALTFCIWDERQLGASSGTMMSSGACCGSGSSGSMSGTGITSRSRGFFGRDSSSSMSMSIGSEVAVWEMSRMEVGAGQDGGAISV